MASDRLDVLVVGGGAREHALVRGLSRSRRIGRLVAAPGNAGIAAEAQLAAVAAEDVPALVELVERERFDLVVVGPEAPLVAGLADRLRERGIAVFGPGADGARMEGSKAFAKEIMQAAGVPTGRAATFTDHDEALGLSARSRGSRSHQGRRAGRRQGRHSRQDPSGSRGRPGRVLR